MGYILNNFWCSLLFKNKRISVHLFTQQYKHQITKAMKGNLILIVLIILTAVSCNQKPQKQEEKSQPIPITEAEKRKIEIQDSLKQVEIDSLALIAWGDAKFGMSMKQTYATEAFNNGMKHSDQIVMDFDRKRKFAAASGLESLYSIRSIFKENELIRIQIESYNLGANEIDKLLKDCNIFIDNFKEKYGEPSFIIDNVNVSDFDSTEERKYAEFNIGAKKITILLQKRPTDYKYCYLIYIDNEQFPKKKRTPTEKEIKETEKYFKELKEVKKNSF